MGPPWALNVRPPKSTWNALGRRAFPLVLGTFGATRALRLSRQTSPTVFRPMARLWRVAKNCLQSLCLFVPPRQWQPRLIV